jgi:hypothetical protein
MFLARKASLFLSISCIAATIGDNDDDLRNDAMFDSSVQGTANAFFGGSTCALWMAPSTLFHGELGLYSGLNVLEGTTVGQGDLNIPVFDANMNEWSPWHDLLWKEDFFSDIQLQCFFEVGAFRPGIGSMLRCNEGHGNVAASSNETVDCLGVHRNNDPAAGSFSCRHKFEFHASQPISEGQELVLACDSSTPSSDYVGPSPRRSYDWLQENHAICLDSLVIQPSKVAPGHGAFSKTRVKAGHTVTSSPVALLHRSHLEIVEIFETSNDETFARRGKVKYTENVMFQQLLLNYAYGHPDSNVLLLPYGPGVNFINHAGGNGSQANVRIRWSRSPLSDIGVLHLNAIEASMEAKGQILVDYIAFRDIEAGEEILLDYGSEWQAAWNMHAENWVPPSDSEKYVSAADYMREFGHRLLTMEEQRENPYPETIITACSFGCLRPCTLLERLIEGGEQFYLVRVSNVSNRLAREYCSLDEGTENRTHRVPAKSIYLIDDAYTGDQHLRNGFRHEIGVETSLFPPHWMARDPNPMGDFLLPKLKPGEIEPIRWAENNKIVTPNAYLIGLSSQIRLELLKYCDRMGISETFRDLTVRGNPLEPEQEEEIVFHGLNWYIQRPAKFWLSNIHWISPADEKSNTDYLMALSAAGFDHILSSVGTQMDLKGLACYHITFIAISYSKRGYEHYDLTQTAPESNKSRGFNIIIPLILANETGPELDVSATDFESVGRLRYQYDIAVMVRTTGTKVILFAIFVESNRRLQFKLGDDAHHASSATDYRLSKEVRMAATVYIADIDEGNIRQIMADYTQKYPPSDRPDLLLGMAGTHWNAKDPDTKLPKPNKAFEALSSRSKAEDEIPA